MPSDVTLGPPEMARPEVFSFALPIVMLPSLPRSMLFFNLMATFPSVASVVILLSPFTASVPSNLTAPLVPVSPVKVIPVVVIAFLLSATSFIRPLSVSPIVVCNALISLVLSATLVFKLPTVIAESAPPSLTSSAILPELIVVPVRVALLSVAPSAFAYALNALNTVPPDTAFAFSSAISPSG